MQYQGQTQGKQEDATLLSMLMPIKNLIYKTEIKNKKLKEQLVQLLDQPPPVMSQIPQQPPQERRKPLLQSSEPMKLALNDPRAEDLTPEEKMIAYLNAQEQDTIRLLSQLDKDSEVYQHKLSQYKELSQHRMQMEKLIHKQRIDKLCMDDGVDEEERLMQIREEERRKANIESIEAIASNRAVKQSNSINKFESFRVHWDYVTGLPISIGNIIIAFSTEYNRSFTEIQEISQTDCIRDSFNPTTNMCEILKSCEVNEVLPNPDIRLVIEVKTIKNSGDVEAIGWSRISLYDYMNQLINGLFVLYLFSDKEISFDDEAQFIRGLHKVPQARLYIRIARMENDFVNSFKPNLQSKSKYSIPHLLNVQYENIEEDMPAAVIEPVENVPIAKQNTLFPKAKKSPAMMSVIPENPNEENSPLASKKIVPTGGIRGVMCNIVNIKQLPSVKAHYVCD